MPKNLSAGEEWLGPLLTEPKKTRKESQKRKKPFLIKTIKEAEVQEYLDNGWEIDKKQKLKVRVRFPRGVDEKLENRTWLLFYQMGYSDLNEGRNFKIKVERKGVGSLEKQVDVFAKDDETVIVAECKASTSLRRRSLQKDIEEFANLKGPMSRAIKKHYGQNFKPKIIWLFVTDNIIWSDPDKERATGENIQIITQKELPYYLQISDHLGIASKYQFLAQFLKNQKIPELLNYTVPAICGFLGEKKYYSFVTTPKQLLKISFINHRSLDDPDGAPTYQRLVSRTRLKQIGRFITDGGFFPTNFLINFHKKVRFDPIKKDLGGNIRYGQLYLPGQYRSAWIIDGQHRLYSYAHLDPKFLNQNIVVIAFERLKIEDEANLFVTINHEQKSVPKTLLDDLQGELKWGSDKPAERIGAISARLIRILDADIGEPFYSKVTKQGIKASDTICLTVPAIMDGLKRSSLVGRAMLKSKLYEPGPLSGATDKETLERARSVINSYFALIREANSGQWGSGRKGYLCTNVAIQGYIFLLEALINYMEPNKGLDSKELDPLDLVSEIEEYIDPVLKFLGSASNKQIEKEFKVQYGASGPKEYFMRLCRIVKFDFSDFLPEGMETWEAEQSGENIKKAEESLKELNIKVHSYIFKTFKKEYGEKGYFDNGVLDKGIKKRAYEKSLDDDPEKKLPLDNYLDFLDYKKIVENKTHWKLFKSVFNIPEPGEKGISKNLKWMERINKLRRIPAHSTEKRVFRAEDFDYLDYIYEEFENNLNAVESEQETLQTEE